MRHYQLTCDTCSKTELNPTDWPDPGYGQDFCSWRCHDVFRHKELMLERVAEEAKREAEGEEPSWIAELREQREYIQEQENSIKHWKILYKNASTERNQMRRTNRLNFILTLLLLGLWIVV